MNDQSEKGIKGRLMLKAIGAGSLERSNAPLIYDHMERICDSMGVRYPQLLIKPDNKIDVFSIFTGKREKYIVFTSKALTSINEQDMEDVLKMELIRLKDENSIRNTVRYLINCCVSLIDRIITGNVHIDQVPVNETIAGDGYNIRAATDNDLISLFRLQYKTFHEHAFSLHEFRRLLINNSTVQVIDKDGKVIGYILGRIKLNRSGLYGRVDSLAVDEDHRSMGLGRLLMINELKKLYEARCRYVVLEVMINNLKAIKFYDSLGFKVIGIKKDFYTAGLDAIIMKI